MIEGKVKDDKRWTKTTGPIRTSRPNPSVPEGDSSCWWTLIWVDLPALTALTQSVMLMLTLMLNQVQPDGSISPTWTTGSDPNGGNDCLIAQTWSVCERVHLSFTGFLQGLGRGGGGLKLCVQAGGCLGLNVSVKCPNVHRL